MRKIFLIFIIILLFSFPSEIFNQTLKTGTTSAQILKLNVGPRAIGMGGAYTSVANDILATYWNPAGTAEINSNEALFNHTDMYLDIKHDYAAFSTNLLNFGTLGAFVSVLSMGEMLVRTTKQPEGTGEFFDAGALVIGLNYSRFLTENFAIGFNAKYINEHIWNMNASGFAIDVGTLYKIQVLNELRIASSISNFGTKLKLTGRDIVLTVPSGGGGKDFVPVNYELDKFDLPLVFKVGISSDIIMTESNRLTVAFDAVHPNDHSEYINSGIEYSWEEIIFFRAGYNSLFEINSEKGLTFGFGLNYMLMDLVKVKFDYAYQDFGRLTNVHYFSVGLIF